ncbi:hypothetical protein, partial [Micromonospora sp. LOL_015]|uniref:hypothetical protein n=1 Tax=Micromonospora sp. LOL_015 TaxID=3345416 RepID=UPI003A875531
MSAALAAEGVKWQEQYVAAVPSTRPHLRSLPTSWLHQLRRVLVLVDLDRPVTPISDASGLTADRELIDDQASMLESHLLCHSDTAGYRNAGQCSGLQAGGVGPRW